MNDRYGTFRNIGQRVGLALQIEQVSRGVVVGDLFNDGKMDAVVENMVRDPMILHHKGGPPSHWISFQLEGVKSNRLALNARVRVMAGDLVQLGEVLGGGSYLSRNDLRVHFGRGTYAEADKAEILWPDGKVETLVNLSSGKFYSVREEAGIVSTRLPLSQMMKRP